MDETNFIKIKVIKTVGEEKLTPKEIPIEDPPDNKNDIGDKIAKTCLYILVFLLPLFFLPLTIAPVEINKQFLALVLILIVFLCYIIRSINSRKIFYPKSLLSLAVLIFLAMAGISAIFSQARLASVFGNFIQPDALLSFLICGLAFFLTAVFIKKEDLTRIGLYFFAGLALTAFFGLFQIFGKFIFPWGFARQTSFNAVGSTASWGIFITFGLVMIVTALISLKPSKIFKIILSLAGLFMIAILAILNYQLLWIGLALTMFLLAMFRYAAKAEMSLPLIIIIISLFFILVNQQLPALISVPTEVRPNFSATFSVIKGTLAGKQILLGSGPATFGFDYSRFRPLALNRTVFWPVRFNQGFSSFATLLATLGVLGILAFLFVIFSFIRRSLRVWKDENHLVIVSGLSFLIINLFIYPAFFAQFFFIFLGLGLLIIGSGKDFEMDFYSGNKLGRARKFIVFLGAILLLSFILFTLYLTSQKYTAAIRYNKGLSSSSLAQSLDNLGKAVRLDSYSDQYLRVLSQAMLLQANELVKTATKENAQSVQLQIQNIIAGALNVARQATELNPVDSLNWSNLASVYEQIMPTKDADVFAEKNYSKVMELEPNNPQGPVDLARVLIVSADQSQQSNEKDAWQDKLNKAKTALDQSVNLKSDYAPAHFLIAQIHIREGNLDKAIERVEEVKRTNLNDAGLAFQLGFLYYRNNQFDQAQAEFERAVGLNENYSNARYFLGLIYDQKGYKQEAIAQFKKIEKLNPDTQEVKNILANLRVGRPALESIAPPAQPPAERIEAPVPEVKKQEKPTGR